MYRIMLVEDEMLVRESMAQNTNWQRFGFEAPHVFENGQQALEQLEAVQPDVLITDICMPFMDGLELARHVYERFPQTIVVVLTGFSEFSYAQQAIRYHVHDYLLKPVKPQEFDELLKNLSAELSARENRQGLFSRAVMADEVLKDHFYQGLLQPEGAQEPDEVLRAVDAELVGRLHSLVLVPLAQRSEEAPQRIGARVAQVCAPALFRTLAEQYLLLIVSGDETAELMARTAVGARQLRAQLHEQELYAPVGVSGVHAGLEGLRQAAQEARHALGYAFSTGETLLFDPELRKSAGSLQTEDCPTAALIASTLQSGSGSRALELTGTLFTCMRRRRVHESECRQVIQRLQILMASHLSREQLRRAPAVLLPQTGYALEEVRLSVERLEGYILQCQTQHNDTPADRCGRMAVAYINEHYSDSELKLPDILEHLGVSRSYFSTVFKEKTGQSFVEYLTGLRMEKAKEYLRETGLCTYEIAERIGFADPHYFSLTFRRRIGMTPKQYREAEK